ncbi:transcriptional regulator [Chromatium okenii]|nr:transcriptional regulator [Chromatium okenii]
MALTRNFKETVVARVQSDPAFAQALFDEAINLFLNGESDTAKLVLRDLINATIGFESLSQEIYKPIKSLHRMLLSSGNPNMNYVSVIFAAVNRPLKIETRKWITHNLMND